MTRNVGRIDRALRIVVGVVVFFFFFLLEPPQNAIGLLGLLPLGTAIIGWCPPYRIFGINSCTAAEREQES